MGSVSLCLTHTTWGSPHCSHHFHGDCVHHQIPNTEHPNRALLQKQTMQQDLFVVSLFPAPQPPLNGQSCVSSWPHPSWVSEVRLRKLFCQLLFLLILQTIAGTNSIFYTVTEHPDALSFEDMTPLGAPPLLNWKTSLKSIQNSRGEVRREYWLNRGDKVNLVNCVSLSKTFTLDPFQTVCLS